MEGLTLRTAQTRDLEDICRVWERSFGDGPETVKKLLGPERLENTVVAELEGHVRCLMSGFDGLRFGSVRAGYIFALCTQPEYRGRGLGAMVLRGAASRAFENGAELVCLHPASAGLALWYGELGLETLSRTAPVSPAEQPGSGAVSLRPVSAAEYAVLRAGAFPRVPEELLRAQELFYTGADGGLFELSCGGARGCVCVQGARYGMEIRELLFPESGETAAAAAVSERFGRAVSLIRHLPADAREGGIHLMGLWKSAGVKARSDGAYLPFILD